MSHSTDYHRFGPILSQYGLTARYIEDYGHVKKVHTDQGIYALKLARMSEDQVATFPQIFSYLQRQGFHGFVHPIPTYRGQLLISHGGAYYYLQPWLEQAGTRRDHLSDMLKQLGRLHSLTSRMITVSENHYEQFYSSLRMKWQQRLLFMERFIDRCERFQYMSPFEWLTITHFYRLMVNQTEAFSLLDQSYEEVQTVQKVRVAFAKGNDPEQHYLYDHSGKGRFVHFENGFLQSPVDDIYRVLNQMSTHSANKATDAFRILSDSYLKMNPLRKEEKYLLASLLMHPEPFYLSLKRYTKHSDRISEMELVGFLEQQIKRADDLCFIGKKMAESVTVDEGTHDGLG